MYHLPSSGMGGQPPCCTVAPLAKIMERKSSACQKAGDLSFVKMMKGVSFTGFQTNGRFWKTNGRLKKGVCRISECEGDLSDSKDAQEPHCTSQNQHFADGKENVAALQ